MILVILGIIDILAGIILALSRTIPFAGSGFILTVGVVVLLKGIWSLLTAFVSGFFFDVLGLIDLFSGILLLLCYFGTSYNFFVYIGIIIIIKGIYSFIMGITGS